MLPKIEILLSESKCYTQERYWGEALHRALQELSCPASLTCVKGEKLLSYLNAPKEGYTLSFTDVSYKKPLSALTGLPHFHWDHPFLYPNNIPFPFPCVEVTAPDVKRLYDLLFFDALTTENATLIATLPGRIDLFGAHSGANWLRRLENGSNIYLHAPLPYSEHFEALKEAKIFVVTHSHEWILPALSCGALPITLCDALPDLVDHYLTHENERSALVHQFMSKLLPSHTMRARAEQLLALL